MNLGPGVPSWVLRVAVLLSVTLITILLTAQGVSLMAVATVVVPGLLAAAVPASPAPAVVIVATAVCAAVISENPLDIAVLALLPLVHVVHVASALAAVIPGTARIHMSALRPVAVRFVIVQGAVFALAGIAALLPRTVTPAVVEVAALLGAAALAAVATKLIMNRPQ
jgi:hypothetical protein